MSRFEQVPPRLEAEIEKWPGVVIVGIKQGRKHRKLTLRYGDTERFLPLSTTPSDWRAGRKQVTDVRRVLSDLGATRSERAKATVRRSRNRHERPVLGQIERAPVKGNPFEALSAVQFSDPPKLSWWRKLLSRMTSISRDC